MPAKDLSALALKEIFTNSGNDVNQPEGIFLNGSYLNALNYYFKK